MKKTMIALLILNILFNLVSWYYLPDQVAMHFGAHGLADSWGDKNTNLMLFIGLDVLMFLLFYYSPALAFVKNGAYLSIPNKEYWFTEENRQDLYHILALSMYEFGASLMLFLLGVGWLTYQANQVDPARLNGPVFAGVAVLFMLYTVYWIIQFYKRLRIPDFHGDIK